MGHLAGLVNDAGYTLNRGACPPGIQGYTDPGTCHVRVRDDVSSAQAVKTLAHDLAHIRADHFARFPDYAVDLRYRGQAEIGAEPIAYIVTTHAGMDSSAYAVPYVAGWAQGDSSLVRECLGQVVTTSSALIAAESSDTDASPSAPPPSTSSLPRRAARSEQSQPSPSGWRSSAWHPRQRRGP
ncbi:hypothetical protein [Cellulomonas dongxiuzhuiae]|uniref:IrrE N-terminal-like domain-containing protein n=1 Tax=Cellulomonas dongxiuzhuiae TaxID=2819979 RepID=A0ABX8GHH9_9CELL|nr:hypothetical protein [Cellulomonas dongxiuzhuiae]MBO3088246.1 hypothetical protein [Cellulomonas dongxiuzhuiae]MBO3094407.1 hypothetical protein [Cellulomonas dongxiuzhuiae]QWC15435.1 hypothetical protein KKR89_14185 [Cellulomonas dongxiuzhuiae]